jgi:TPR repeat protein
MAMPIRLAILCALRLVLNTSAFAQDIVTDCDKYAASHLDPQRKAAGVTFENMNVALAVPACEDAVRQYPNSVRLAYQLGRTYEKADKLTAAVEQYRKAADQNYAAAQLTLGGLYANGEGVPKDDQQYIFWARKAADQGYAVAQDALGYAYSDGRGVPKDDQQAAVWFRKAADQGYAPAQDRLGFMYQNGEGVPKDDQQAVAWFRKAADQGYAFAQYRLGAMYANGEGVAKDDQQAVVWFRKAAEQGNKEAKTKLDELESLQNANGMR